MTTAAWIFWVSQLAAPAYLVFAADVHIIAGVGWGGHGGDGAGHEAGRQERGACRKVSIHARLPTVPNWIPSRKVVSLAPISSLRPRFDSLLAPYTAQLPSLPDSCASVTHFVQ